MTHRSTRIELARALVALMLFAQGAMAWSACDWLVSSPVRAVQTAAEAAPCHESPNVAMCLTHCLSDRQAVQKIVFDVPAMPSAPVLKLIGLAAAPLGAQTLALADAQRHVVDAAGFRALAVVRLQVGCSGDGKYCHF